MPTALATTACTGPAKKIHTWAPRPDCEISNPAGTPLARAALR
nr:hypothetical protein [Virgisporangium aurantiacum]